MSKLEVTVADDLAQDALDQILADGGLVRTDRSIVRLSGLTNRIFRVETDRGLVAVRLPGTGTDAYIDRAAELHNAAIASQLGIGPLILHAAEGAMVMGFLDGRALSPDAMRSEPATLVGAARLLRLVHDAPSPFAGRFDAFEVIAGHRGALAEAPTGIDELIARIGRIDPPTRLVPCHNDPWPENFLDAGDRLHLLDWEYSAMGDPAWDLADVVVESELDVAGTEALLGAYADGPVDPDLRARVAAMGPVTDLLWGLWALVQDQDGNDAMDFGSYARQRLRRADRSTPPR